MPANPDTPEAKKRRLENALRRYRRLWRSVQGWPGRFQSDRKKYYAAMCERYYKEIQALKR